MQEGDNMIKVTFKIGLTVLCKIGRVGKKFCKEYNWICSDEYHAYNPEQSKMLNFGIIGKELNRTVKWFCEQGQKQWQMEADSLRRQ